MNKIASANGNKINEKLIETLNAFKIINLKQSIKSISCGFNVSIY